MRPARFSTFSSSFHSYHPAAGIRQRWLRSAWRHIGLVAASSLRALKLNVGGVGFFHQGGISPQRAGTTSCSPWSLSRTMGT
ncbi:hypothetical protein D3C76_1403350 [compost metagenome]